MGRSRKDRHSDASHKRRRDRHYDDDEEDYIEAAQTVPLISVDLFSTLVERDNEEEAVDLAIDSAVADLLCVGHTDCKLLKKNPFVRRYIKNARSEQIAFFQEMVPRSTHSSSTRSRHDGNKEKHLYRDDDDETDEYWDFKRDLETLQSPLRVTSDLCHQIYRLPERDVTIYIRLDEEVPKDSCTAYEVDWEGYHSNQNKNLFRCFRLCSRQARSFRRTECIVGTFASACLHPYTLIVSGTTITTKSRRQLANGEKADGPPTAEAPFRPKRLLLDRPEDICTAELQFLLNRMGLSEVREVHPKLRELHDAAELDFFPDDPEERGEESDTERDHSDDEVPSFLAGHVVQQTQNKTLGGVLAGELAGKYSCSGMLKTSMPFICLLDDMMYLETFNNGNGRLEGRE